MDKNYKIIFSSTAIILVIAFASYFYFAKQRVNSKPVASIPFAYDSASVPVPPEGTGNCELPDGSFIADPTRCEPIKQYRSAHLGVEFQIHNSARIFEDNNRIYVNSFSEGDVKEGQYVEIITKPATQTLLQKVSQLNGSTHSQCRVATEERSPVIVNSRGNEERYPDSYQAVSVMAHETDFDRAAENKPLLCQSKYAGLNGMTYFLADKDVPTKLAFFVIGQASISAGPYFDWYHTFRFTK